MIEKDGTAGRISHSDTEPVFAPRPLTVRDLVKIARDAGIPLRRVSDDPINGDTRWACWGWDSSRWKVAVTRSTKSPDGDPVWHVQLSTGPYGVSAIHIQMRDPRPFEILGAAYLCGWDLPRWRG